MADRRGGIIELKVGAELYECKGNFSWNLGQPKNEAITGSSGVTGYKSTPQVAYIEGMVTDRGALSVQTLVQITDATVHLKLATGKVIVLSGAWYAADGKGTTDEGEIELRFESAVGEEISA
jgi:hypothetical protein